MFLCIYYKSTFNVFPTGSIQNCFSGFINVKELAKMFVRRAHLNAACQYKYVCILFYIQRKIVVLDKN